MTASLSPGGRPDLSMRRVGVEIERCVRHGAEATHVHVDGREREGGAGFEQAVFELDAQVFDGDVGARRRPREKGGACRGGFRCR